MISLNVTQTEIWQFMGVYADMLVNYLKPQNCVPGNILAGPAVRLEYWRGQFDYNRALAGRTRTWEKEAAMAAALTEEEVVILMRNAAGALAQELMRYRGGRRTDYIRRLSELDAVMPPEPPEQRNDG